MSAYFRAFESWLLEQPTNPTPPVVVEGGASHGELELEGRRVLNAAATDVLGLGADPRVREAAQAALRKYGPHGAAHTRLGSILEERLAAFFHREDAVVVGSVDRLLGPLGDAAAVIAVDGRSDRPLRSFFLHRGEKALAFNDIAIMREAIGEDLAEPTLVVAAAVHPLEGDLADLPRLIEATERAGSGLVLDESLALGVLGNDGSGAADHFGETKCTRVLTLCSFGTALGSRGYVLAGPRAVIRFVRSQLDIDAGLAPASIAAATRALELLQAEPQRRTRLLDVAQRLHDGLAACGFDTGPSVTHRVPIWVGDEVRCERLARALLEEGVFTRAAPLRQRARLLLTPQATHSDAQVDQLVDALEQRARRLGILESVRPAPRPAALLARPGSFAVSAPAGAHWNEEHAAIAASESSLSSVLGRIPSKEIAGKLFDAVETLTWRAANFGSSDLQRLWNRRKTLRNLLNKKP